MTSPPIPNATAADITRVVQRDFPIAQVAEVLAMLDEYGRESWQREPHRVRIAICKLAAGSVERLQNELEAAKNDYRDVLAAAEHPRYMQQLFVSNLPPEEQQRIVDADWQQYQEWLTR